MTFYSGLAQFFIFTKTTTDGIGRDGGDEDGDDDDTVEVDAKKVEQLRRSREEEAGEEVDEEGRPHYKLG